MRKRLFALCALLLALALLAGCGAKQPAPTPEPTVPVRSVKELIGQLALARGSGGDGDAQAAALLEELRGADPDAAARWERILALWQRVDTSLSLNYDVLPDGLPDSDELAIVVLGFQLTTDGRMRPELIERLGVALRSAEKYPNARVICTGGGTALKNAAVTEAGEMAKWLAENGVAPERIIAEDRSLSTAQNAVNTFALLTKDYPQIRQLALVSSDYHIATGTLLFGAESILLADTPDGDRCPVVSNAAYRAPFGTLSVKFQAGALIELNGDTDTAFSIYRSNYDMRLLPTLE